MDQLPPLSHWAMASQLVSALALEDVATPAAAATITPAPTPAARRASLVWAGGIECLLR